MSGHPRDKRTLGTNLSEIDGVLVDLIARVERGGPGGGAWYKRGIDIQLATHGYAVIGPPPLHTKPN
jgi:hypothetical protein